MKQEILGKLEKFKNDLLDLRKEVNAIPGKTVYKVSIRKAADAVANEWVEDLRSPLEYKLKIPISIIQSTSEQIKKLYILSRPNNLKESYLSIINALLNKFDDKFVLPIKQTSLKVETLMDLQTLIPSLADPSESNYLQEAIDCANSGFKRAAVVLCWCAGIDKIQKALLRIGLSQFNQASKTLKLQTSGKFKKWNKEFSIINLAELQTIFDDDLLVVIEGMGLIDGNQADRLHVDFQWRNQSAHPGLAPIEDPHIVAFFTDINSIIFQNPKLVV